MKQAVIQLGFGIAPDSLTYGNFKNTPTEAGIDHPFPALGD